MTATLLGISGMVARAVTDEEVSSLLAESLLLPDWESVFTATTGAGYKDNVFLSHADPQGKAFVTAAGELLILRLAPLGSRFNLFGNAEARHYFGGGPAYQEYTSFSQARLEYDFTENFTGAIAGQYYYQDQILDVSVSETNRQPIAVLGHTFNLRPEAQLKLAGKNWIALETPATRQFFESPLDDYWEAGAKLTVGRSYGWDSKLALSYAPYWRSYDADPERTASGQAITNSHRLGFQQEARITWRHHWDEQKHWRTVATLGGRLNDEHGGGFYDYTRWFVSGRIQYRAHAWEVSAEGRYTRYDYQVQSVSPANPAKRNRTDWTAVLEVERQLSQKVAVVMSYEFETTLSNDPLETYSVNTVSTALRWEF